MRREKADGLTPSSWAAALKLPRRDATTKASIAPQGGDMRCMTESVAVQPALSGIAEHARESGSGPPEIEQRHDAEPEHEGERGGDQAVDAPRRRTALGLAQQRRRQRDGVQPGEGGDAGQRLD